MYSLGWLLPPFFFNEKFSFHSEKRAHWAFLIFPWVSPLAFSRLALLYLASWEAKPWLLSTLRICCPNSYHTEAEIQRVGIPCFAFRSNCVALLQGFGWAQVLLLSWWVWNYLSPECWWPCRLVSALAQFSNSKTKFQLPPCFTIIFFCTDSLFRCAQTFSFCCCSFHGSEVVLLFLLWHPFWPFLWLVLQETNNASCKCLAWST